MLTPRENFLQFLRKEDYEWTPTNFDMLWFRPTFIPDHVARGFVAQQKPYSGPYGGKDLFGVEWVFDPISGGSMDVCPLSDDIEDWESFLKVPDLDTIDWERHAKENTEYLTTDKLIASTIYTGYFERLISFVGFENAAVALVDEDQHTAVHAIFERITENYIDLIGRMKRYFNVELMEIHDDWGTQRSPLMSADVHREMIMPYFKRVTTAAREMGVLIEQHSCGKIEPLFGNMVESGVATWRGQNICDRHLLVDTYGDRFAPAIYLQPEAAMPDEDVLDYARHVLEQWHGKDVWVWIRAPYTEPQQHMVDRMLKTGHI